MNKTTRWLWRNEKEDVYAIALFETKGNVSILAVYDLIKGHIEHLERFDRRLSKYEAKKHAEKIVCAMTI